MASPKVDIPVARKAALFDTFIFETLVRYIHVSDAVNYLRGQIDPLELVSVGDNEQEFKDVINALLDDELKQVIRQLLPKIMEDDLGAKKVTIQW